MSPAAPAPRVQPAGTDVRALVPLAPQGPVELVDTATHVVRTRFADLMSVSLAVQVPIWLVLAVLLRDQWASGLSDNDAWLWAAFLPDPIAILVALGDNLDGGALAVTLSRVLPSIGLAATGATCGLLVRDWSIGRPTRGLEALGRVARQGHRLLGLWALVHIVEVVTVVGIWLGPFVFGVAAPLLGMERSTAVRAFRRSWSLSINNLGRSIGAVMCASFVASLVGGLLAGVPLILLGGLFGQWIDVGGTATTALASAAPHIFVDPLLAMAMATLALDLKIRSEALDLETLLEGDTGG